MKQFKPATTIKPIRSGNTLSITSNRNDSARTKSKKAKRGGTVARSKIHKVYSNKHLLGNEKPKKKYKAVEDVEQAKNIFITGMNEEPEKPNIAEAGDEKDDEKPSAPESVNPQPKNDDLKVDKNSEEK